jgi:hypothetical protein
MQNIKDYFYMFTLLSLFWKINVDIWAHLAVGVSVFVSPTNNFWMPNLSVWDLVFISYQLRNSLISLTSNTKFLRQNLNIAWTPVPIYMKLGKHMPAEPISTAHFTTPFHQLHQQHSLSNFWDSTSILLERLCQSLRDLVCISCHLVNDIPKKSLSSVVPTLQILNLLR